jgi:hypothetical protein
MLMAAYSVECHPPGRQVISGITLVVFGGISGFIANVQQPHRARGGHADLSNSGVEPDPGAGADLL